VKCLGTLGRNFWRTLVHVQKVEHREFAWGTHLVGFVQEEESLFRVSSRNCIHICHDYMQFTKDTHRNVCPNHHSSWLLYWQHAYDTHAWDIMYIIIYGCFLVSDVH
jgi:hypothetical protein